MRWSNGRTPLYKGRMPQNLNGWPMRGLMGWLARRAIPADADPSAADARARLGMLEGWTSTGISVVLSVLKLVLGWMTGSIAVVADGINNLADVGSSLVIAFGFKWSRKPRDRDHPFGHSRLETVAALVLSVALVMVGADVAKESIGRLLEPRPVEARPFVVILLVGTIAIKEWLALFALRLARITRSPVLRADSWNHHFDVLSTILVVLALLATRFGVLSVDGWAGLAVSGIILYTGYRYAKESVSVLLGEAPTAEEIAGVHRAAIGVGGVLGVHDIIMHNYGDHRVASLHIEVDAVRTALDVHDLAENVEQVVEQGTGCKTTVHVDPVDRSHPAYEVVKGVMEALLARDGRIVSYHDLRVSGSAGACDVFVDIVVRLDVPESSYGELSKSLVADLRSGMKGVQRAFVTVEGSYSEKGQS